jgi:ABC-2 type transport system ATP-binding protein
MPQTTIYVSPRSLGAPDERPPAVVTTDLARLFAGSPALAGVSLQMRAGGCVALLGPNGAGKTTTVRLLDGVLRPHGGRATVLGLDPETEGDAVRRRTGVLTENAGLDDRLTAAENLEMTGRIRGMARKEAARRAAELLERFAMADRADVVVQGFSTGQRKRLALARALLHDPDVLMLDEPTTGLDPVATREAIELIGTLATEHGRTVVLCTHFLGEAGRLANRVAVLHLGRLRALGRPDDLAAKLLPGLAARVDLGTAADPLVVDGVAALAGVLTAHATPEGLALGCEDSPALARVVAYLVGREIPVFAAVPQHPSLEDLYFEIQHRLDADPDWTMA